MTTNERNNDGGQSSSVSTPSPPPPSSRKGAEVAQQASWGSCNNRRRVLFVCLALAQVIAMFSFYLVFRLMGGSGGGSQQYDTTTENVEQAAIRAHLQLNSSLSSHRRTQHDGRQKHGRRQDAVIRSNSSASARTRPSEEATELTILEEPKQLQVMVPSTPDLVATKKNASSSSKDDSCFVHNSRAWLEGPRLGNANESLMDAEQVRWMIIDFPSVLSSPFMAQEALEQSLCHEKSRFVNPREADESNEKTVRLWTVRLIYLAYHYHQHRLAIPEARARYERGGGGGGGSGSGYTAARGKNCASEMEKRGIGLMDYECPGAKYIIASLSGNGIGANVRAGAVSTMVAGLATDRIVLFVNNSPRGDKYLRSPWLLSSCDRRDMQCFFRPMSPCVLTHDDLGEAYALTKPETRQLLTRHAIPKDHENDKVWQVLLGFQPVTQIRESVKRTLHARAVELLKAVVPERDPRHSVMKKAAEAILSDTDAPRRGYDYAAANIKISHALAFYATRPSITNQRKLNSMMDEITPQNFDPETAVGLPIRASDKCIGESQCLNFFQHMQVVAKVWLQHLKGAATNNGTTAAAIANNNNNDKSPSSIVFTTEASNIVQEQKAFLSDPVAQAKLPVPFNFGGSEEGKTTTKFVTNSMDVQQDTGFVKVFVRRNTMNQTADTLMLATLSSLKTQLLPRVTIANCCSNFHTLLGDFLKEGCGAASENMLTCLNELDDPEFAICCGWHRDCKAARAKALQKRNMTGTAR